MTVRKIGIEEIAARERQREEQIKIADSILDSVYLKLLSAEATKEAIQQMMTEAGLDDRDGPRFLIGKLMFKITESFLNEKEINSQQCRKAIEILRDLKCGADYKHFDEYSKDFNTCSAADIGCAVRACTVDMAIRKLEQECPNLSELRDILKELDIRLDA
jgi:hypothetical protein